MGFCPCGLVSVLRFGVLEPRLTTRPTIILWPVPFFEPGTLVGTSLPKVSYELTKNGYELT